MTPQAMAGWNLGLRFVLELVALVGLGAAAWTSASGTLRWVGVIGVPVVAATVWGVFNVLDDPSRSGRAPVEVAGWIRLVIEVVVLGAGAFALGSAFGRSVGVGFSVVVLAHYLVSWSRVRWLVSS